MSFFSRNEEKKDKYAAKELEDERHREVLRLIEQLDHRITRNIDQLNILLQAVIQKRGLTEKELRKLREIDDE